MRLAVVLKTCSACFSIAWASRSQTISNFSLLLTVSVAIAVLLIEKDLPSNPSIVPGFLFLNSQLLPRMRVTAISHSFQLEHDHGETGGFGLAHQLARLLA